MFLPLSILLCHLMTISSVPSPDYGHIKLFQSPETYSVDTAFLLKDVNRELEHVGYRIKAQLTVESVWNDGDAQHLLKFHLQSPQLHLRGKHKNAEFLPHPSIWDSHSSTVFYAHWLKGLILAPYLNGIEPLDIVNYKKSLLSLFQFQVMDGEEKETDVSGACDILYETLSINSFRKIKRRCSWDGDGTSEEVVRSRRVTSYQLTDSLDALESVHAEEVHEVGSGGAMVVARAWHHIKRLNIHQPTASGRPETGGTGVPYHLLPSGLLPHPLSLSATDEDTPLHDIKTSPTNIISAAIVALSDSQVGLGGSAENARVLLNSMHALRDAESTEFTALLQRLKSNDQLTAALRVLGLAGTRDAFSAASTFLQLYESDSLENLAQVYLSAAALCEQPSPRVVNNMLDLSVRARNAAVRESALLAAGAGVSTLEERFALDLRDRIVNSLARCSDERCRVIRLKAVANMRRDDTADLALEHAERGSLVESLAALDALSVLPIGVLLTEGRLSRLADLASSAKPLEVRAAALDLVLKVALKHDSVPLSALNLAANMRSAPAELRRVFWQRLEAVGDLEKARKLLKLLPPPLKSWDVRAAEGTSSVLVRATGWSSGGWSTNLESVQVAAGGVLKRGVVRLLAVDPKNDTSEVLSVELWTRGLQSVTGGDAPSDEETPAQEESVAGGLSFTVGGVRLKGVTLFDGHTELLGHVWSGTGSEPTPVLRELRPLSLRSGRLPLICGASMRAHHGSALALALDAHAQVSLWARTARAHLTVRAGGASKVEARVRTSWGFSHATSHAEASPRLSVSADLDFYERPMACVRARLDQHVPSANVTLQSRQGKRALRIKRHSAEKMRLEGRTLSLGALNDVTCRTLAAHDAE